MIFRVVPNGDGYTLTVEDEEGVVLSIPAASLEEAEAIREKGVIEGVEAIQSLAAPNKAAGKKKAS